MQNMYYIGLDVHKRTISYCLKDGSGTIHAEGTIAATRFDLDCYSPPRREHTVKYWLHFVDCVPQNCPQFGSKMSLLTEGDSSKGYGFIGREHEGYKTLNEGDKLNSKLSKV